MKLGPKQQAWVDDLRSGNFAQGRSKLHNNGAFCCLGVLCNRYTPVEEVKVDEGSGSTRFYGEASYLPTEIRKELKMRSYNGNIDGASLASLNDDGSSFAEISDLIELHAVELFYEAV